MSASIKNRLIRAESTAGELSDEIGRLKEQINEKQAALDAAVRQNAEMRTIAENIAYNWDQMHAGDVDEQLRKIISLRLLPALDVYQKERAVIEAAKGASIGFGPHTNTREQELREALDALAKAQEQSNGR